MSDLTDLLDQLAVPDHGDDFWDSLEHQLTDEPDSSPEPIDPRTGAQLTPHPDAAHGKVTHLDHRRRVRRWVLAGLAATAAVIVLVVIGTGGFSQDSAPGPVVTEPDPPPTISTPSTSTTTSTPGPPTEPDGNDPETLGDEIQLLSAGLPISVSQATDLSEGGSIVITAEGFTPGSQVGAVQCYGPIPEDGPPAADLATCDLGYSQTATADDLGAVTLDFDLRRYITSQFGPADCAFPESPNVCTVAVGELADIGNFGITELSFDPEGPGTPPPFITLSKTDGLAHEETVTVEGAGFEPGETVMLASCSADELVEWCMFYRGARKALVGEDGVFTAEVRVKKFVESMLCDRNPELGCLFNVLSLRQASPVPISFADPPRGSTPWLQQLGEVEGTNVARFRVPLLDATPGEEFTARRCQREHDQGSPLLPLCGPAVAGVMDETGGTFELDVGPLLDGADPDGRSFTGHQCITDPESRFSPQWCSIRVETPTFLFPHFTR